jgi:hypothetical protein
VRVCETEGAFLRALRIAKEADIKLVAVYWWGAGQNQLTSCSFSVYFPIFLLFKFYFYNQVVPPPETKFAVRRLYVTVRREPARPERQVHRSRRLAARG